MVLRVLGAGGKLTEQSEEDYFKSKRPNQKMSLSEMSSASSRSLGSKGSKGSKASRSGLKKKKDSEKKKMKKGTKAEVVKQNTIGDNDLSDSYLYKQKPLTGTTIATAPLSPSTYNGSSSLRLKSKSPKRQLSAWELREAYKQQQSPSGNHRKAAELRKRFCGDTNQTLPEALRVAQRLSDTAPRVNLVGRSSSSLGKKKKKRKEEPQTMPLNGEPSSMKDETGSRKSSSSKSKPRGLKKSSSKKMLKADRAQAEAPKRTKSTGDAGSKSKKRNRERPIFSPSKSSPQKIIDMVPHCISLHSSTRDTETEDETSLATFNSTLTPSIASQMANEDDLNMDVFEDNDDDDNVIDKAEAKAWKLQKHMLKSPPKQKISKLRTNSIDGSDEPPSKPKSKIKIKKDKKEKSPKLPQRQLSNHQLKNDKQELSSSPMKRWKPKTNYNDLPPAFAMMNASFTSMTSSPSKPSSVSKRSKRNPKQQDDEPPASSKPSSVSKRSMSPKGRKTTKRLTPTKEQQHQDDDLSKAQTTASSKGGIVGSRGKNNTKETNATEELKSKLASRWTQMNEMRNSTTPDPCGELISPKQGKKLLKKEKRKKKVNDTLKRNKSADLDTSDRSLGKYALKRNKSAGVVNLSQISSVVSSSSTSKSSHKKIRTPEKEEHQRPDRLRRNKSDSAEGSVSSEHSKDSSSKQLQARSNSVGPSTKPKRQPRSLVQPEKLHKWQIREQCKHRVAPTMGLYNRRLDDDEDIPKKSKSKNAKIKAVSAIANPRGTQKVDGSYIGRNERKKTQEEKGTTRSSILDSLSKFENGNAPPPAFQMSFSKLKK